MRVTRHVCCVPGILSNKACVLCAGPLAPYVCEELNVSELKTAHPDEYGVLVAEPNWAAMGTRFGKQMGPVLKAIKALTVAEIRTFRTTGSIEVAGHSLAGDEVRSLISVILLQHA